MTPRRARELLPIITAFANGEEIQCRAGGRFEWMDCPGPSWHEDGVYRIKPKHCLRPWKPEEAPKWAILRPKPNTSYWEINSHSRVFVSTIQGFMAVEPRPPYNKESISYEAALDLCVRIDENGTEHPCGVTEPQT